MEESMYMHMTMLKLMPEKVREAHQSLLDQENWIGGPKIKGIRQAVLIESLDEPGRVIWLTTWASLTEAQNFLSSPGYSHLLRIVQPYLLGTLQEY